MLLLSPEPSTEPPTLRHLMLASHKDNIFAQYSGADASASDIKKRGPYRCSILTYVTYILLFTRYLLHTKPYYFFLVFM